MKFYYCGFRSRYVFDAIPCLELTYHDQWISAEFCRRLCLRVSFMWWTAMLSIMWGFEKFPPDNNAPDVPAFE